MINEQRENIIANDNTAQTRFNEIIENLTKPIKKVVVTEPLNGDIDLSESLKELGAGVPDEISFQKGNITNLYNIPEGILTLNCPENLLISLENIPTSLQELSINNNYIKDINLSALANLEILNVSHNQIEKLENIPQKLKDLKCSNNKISQLNLLNLSNLKTLHVSNNMITLIENMPEGVEDFQMENTPSIEFRNMMEGGINVSSPENEELKLKRKDYKQALNDFFKMKSKYEKNLHELRRKAYDKATSKKMAKEAVNKVVAPCIKCKRQVGSLFSRTRDRYTAKCGDDKEPCSLDIQIFSGDHVTKYASTELFKNDVSDLQIEIIRNRLNNIFDYIDDATSKEIYDSKLKDYNSENQLYNDLLEDYRNTFENSDRKKDIFEKKKELFALIDNNKEILEEYKQTNNKELIKEVVKTNFEDVYRIARHIRNLEHEVMDMDFYKDEGNIYKLFQYPVILEKIETNISGEPSSIIKFNK